MFKKIVFVIVGIALSYYGRTQISIFPAKAEYIRHTPGGPPNNMFVLIEQRGLIAYKGRSCDDVSLAFVSNEDGTKSYGNNEWMDVHVLIQHYKPDGKFTFDQIMQYNPPSIELNKKRDAFKTATAADGTPINYTLKIVDVADGKMLIMNERHVCIESKYKEYTSTFFYSYAIIGTTIVWIDAGYNTADPDIAIKTHAEIVEKIKKAGIN